MLARDLVSCDLVHCGWSRELHCRDPFAPQPSAWFVLVSPRAVCVFGKVGCLGVGAGRLVVLEIRLVDDFVFTFTGHRSWGHVT